MWEKNLAQRLVLIGLVLLIAVLLLYPPKENLRPGLDIAGGVSLIFEIDDTDIDDPFLAERMKQLLQRRVDPQGVFNLTWRVHGSNRIEVQMPLPPKEASERRAAYIEALDKLFAENLKLKQVETALARPPAEREAALQKLAAGSEERAELLQQAAQRYDAYVAARQAAQQGPPTDDATTQPDTIVTQEELDLQLRDASELYQDAVDAVIRTNLDPNRFQEVLRLDPSSSIRQSTLDQMRQDHPQLTDEIDEVLAAYNAWREYRGFLDGPEDLKRLVRGAGVLEFRIVAQPNPQNMAQFDRYRRQLQERGPTPAPGDSFGWFRVESPMAFFNKDTPVQLEAYDYKNDPSYVVEKLGEDYYVLASLRPEDGLLGGPDRDWQLKRVMPNRDQHGRPCVNFELDVVGGNRFEELTRKNIGKPLCILVDNTAYSAPTVQSKISTSGQITGDFSQEKVSYLVNTMQAGSLPARLKETPLSERTIGSSLGATNLQHAFSAGVTGLIVIAILMAIYYGISGMIADTALFMNILLVLAAMSMLQARFTLAGIAGVILTIGMVVDANVLIFERMREERERGSSLRLIIKNGYEKAFSTIIDANITTLLTCVIIYYVGSEEIKGFGLTLGWGIVMSLFTSLFVTRTIFTLLVKYGLLKEIKSLSLIGTPKIDWYSKKKYFVPTSIIIIVLGLSAMYMRGKDKILDVEFLGGVSAEFEVSKAEGDEIELNDVKIRELLDNVAQEFTAVSERLPEATVEPVPGRPNAFHVSLAGLPLEELEAVITEPLDDAGWLMRGGVDPHAVEGALEVRLKGQRTSEQLKNFIVELQDDVREAGKNIGDASIGAVLDIGREEGTTNFWNLTTTEKNKRLVQYGLEQALGDRLLRQPEIRYTFRGENGEPTPVTERRLEVLFPSVPAGATADLTDYLGGAAMYFTDLDPPQSVSEDVPNSLTNRIRNMRLQPGYQDFPYREFEVFGVKPVNGQTDEMGNPLYSSVVVAVADPNFRYSDDPEIWLQEFAQKELGLVRTTMETEQSLRKVSQFKPQIAEQSTTRAGLALLLSWIMIIGYLWIRFGRPIFGISGVAALIHDVLIALAFVGIAGLIGGTDHPIGAFFLIDDFRINMTIVAAFLTIIGYSINDTIVIFDRIRETRGRLGTVTPEIINQSINQCFSRTILTSVTTFLVLLVMYIWGGSSIRGFNYCMMIGIITGTYSSVAIATALLMVGAAKSRAATKG